MRTSDLRRRRRRQKFASIVTNELIVLELERFLQTYYGGRDGGAVLDVGAGSKPYAPLYEPYFAHSTAVDLVTSPHDTGDLDAFASADDLPHEDASFDCVVCTEVLEHCRDPRAVVRELRRVLRPGGRVFLTTPFLVGLHEMPNDYYRYTPSALRDLAATSGFDVLSLRPRGEYGAVALTILQLPVAKAIERLGRRLGVPLYRPSNPLVYLTIVAPQRAYVALWRRFGREDGGPLGHWTLGYVTVLEAREPTPPD